MTTLYFDIETTRIDPKDPNLVKSCHIIALRAPESPVQTFYEGTLYPSIPQAGTLSEGLTELSRATHLIGHNIIGFDLPVLKHLYDWEPHETTKITDTLVMSYLLNPDRRKPSSNTGKSGPHSLESWGCRLGKIKPSHETWARLDPAMLERCIADVGITELTYLALQEEARGHNWTTALDLEHAVARIEAEKERLGVKFDRDKAHEYIDELSNRIGDIDDQLLPNLKSAVKPWGVDVSKPYTVKGTLKKLVLDHWSGTPSELSAMVGGPFTRIKYEPLNLGSVPQVKEYLLKHEGWQPDDWNYNKQTGEKSSPKLTESSLESVKGKLGKLIKGRIVNRHRRSQIEGWLENLREDCRLTAATVPCGTNTGRMRHISVANVPQAKDDVYFGWEMRSLFTASPERELVGHDAKGLELRMLAHYMNDEDFTEAVLHGDIHEFNRERAGLPTRENAKTFIYAFLYGAGDEKIGSIVGGTATHGAALRRDFLRTLPKLEKLIRNVKRASGKGYVKGLDGRKIWMRRDSISGEVKKNTALNCLLQSAGAIIMKEASVILDSTKKEANLDAWKVVDYHDEQVNDVYIPHVEEFMELSVNSVVKAGTEYNLRCPLDADVKRGRTWAEVH
jgi:DNA polymerase I-like protein with 3'-5' exonuclease and polymerase domains